MSISSSLCGKLLKFVLSCSYIPEGKDMYGVWHETMVDGACIRCLVFCEQFSSINAADILNTLGLLSARKNTK